MRSKKPRRSHWEGVGDVELVTPHEANGFSNVDLMAWLNSKGGKLMQRKSRIFTTSHRRLLRPVLWDAVRAVRGGTDVEEAIQDAIKASCSSGDTADAKPPTDGEAKFRAGPAPLGSAGFASGDRDEANSDKVKGSDDGSARQTTPVSAVQQPLGASAAQPRERALTDIEAQRAKLRAEMRAQIVDRELSASRQDERRESQRAPGHASPKIDTGDRDCRSEATPSGHQDTRPAETETAHLPDVVPPESRTEADPAKDEAVLKEEREAARRELWRKVRASTRAGGRDCAPHRAANSGTVSEEHGQPQSRPEPPKESQSSAQGERDTGTAPAPSEGDTDKPLFLERPSKNKPVNSRLSASPNRPSRAPQTLTSRTPQDFTSRLALPVELPPPAAFSNGYIFTCSSKTLHSCLNKKLFGLPQSQFADISSFVEPTTALFLFNFSRRCLHGVFAPVGAPEMNLDPYAWATTSHGQTPFPAQVRVKQLGNTRFLNEALFSKHVNYVWRDHFDYKLDAEQAMALVKEFENVGDAN
mmetsp:Transcript_48845/g.106018  ORF Transcript_48845/g.106018 Transcript_48845/m.106018 type:complete len:529 (+) Transcript_48845:1-1587(+)